MRSTKTLALALLLLACSPDEATVAFRVVHASSDDPFAGADAIVVALERDGALVPGAERRFPPSATSLDVPDLPFGERLAFRVETRLGEFVLARGRSFPFDHAGPAGEPLLSPDVLLGTLGRFAVTSTEPVTTACTIAPTSRGALIASGERWLEYVAHGADASAALVDRGALPAGRTWIALGDRLLGVGVDGATSIASDATTWSSELRLEAPVIAIAALSREGAVAVLADGRVLRLEVHATGLVPTSIAMLREAPSSPRVAVVETSRGARVLVVDVGAVTLIDPEGLLSQHTLALAPAVVDAALIAAGPSTAILAGGREPLDGTRALDRVTAILVRPDQAEPLALFELPPLVPARSGAIAAPLGARLVLVAGGVGDGGAPVRSVEIVDVELPGEVAATGPLPFDAIGCAAMLADRTVLAVGPGGAAIFFPPRER